MWTYFIYREFPYNLRNGSILIYQESNLLIAIQIPFTLTEVTLIWNNLHLVIKSTQTLDEFERKIKNYGNAGCLILNNQLFCNLYTVSIAFYLVIYLIIM